MRGKNIWWWTITQKEPGKSKYAWSGEEVQAFERNTAAFAEVDAVLWN